MTKISEGVFLKSASGRVPLKTQKAWAQYIRDQAGNRDCATYGERTWGLTPGRSRGAAYETITQSTIDQIRAHRNGGLRVILEVEAVAFGTNLRGLLASVLAEDKAKLDDIRQQCERAEEGILALGAVLDASWSRAGGKAAIQDRGGPQL